jgi:hypothetical protein
MHTHWIKGLTGEKKEQRRAEVLAYRNAFDDLREILEKHYDVPNWELRQIAANEYNAVLDDILKTINLTEGK